MARNEQTWRPSMGLAFSEEKEMKMLSEMADRGWIFDSYKYLGYKFKKSESKKLIYCVDIHKVTDGDKEQYLSIFKDGGWEHVCSVGKDLHYFCAAPGTKPIYTDRDTLVEKYRKGTKSVYIGIVVTILVLIASLSIDFFIDETGINRFFSLIVYMVTGACIGLLPVLTITGIAMRIRTKRVKCK